MIESLTPSTPGETKDGSAARGGTTDNEADKQAGPCDTSAIYVAGSAPATLRYSDGVVIYPTLREARYAWLALPAKIKKGAWITIDEKGSASYRGFEIYRLWAAK
jgi:hypothetical protein